MCSQILQEFEDAVYVGLPGAGGDDAIFIITSGQNGGGGAEAE